MSAFWDRARSAFGYLLDTNSLAGVPESQLPEFLRSRYAGGSLTEPYVQLSPRNGAEDITMALYFGPDAPPLSLGFSFGPTPHLHLLSCCGVDLRLVDRRFACSLCSKPLPAALTDFQLPLIGGPPLGPRLLEWLELSMDTLAASLVLPALQTWIEEFWRYVRAQETKWLLPGAQGVRPTPTRAAFMRELSTAASGPLHHASFAKDLAL